LWLPWQSYRATFQAPASWQTVQLPFAGFSPYKTGKALDLTKLERIGVLAIGRAFTADLCIGRVGFY
jgi:D-alanyl-D-alanine dipeptidase